MEIEDLNTFICNLKENLADTYCTLTKLNEILTDYADKIHKHVIADVEGLQAALNNKASKDEATQSISGLMSKNDKKKLDGITTGANKYVHPPTDGTSYAKTGQPTGTQTPDFGETFTVSQVITNSTGHVTALNDKVIKIPRTAADENSGGLMTKGDKKKLDAIESNANNYTHPKPTSSFTAQAQGLYKIRINETGHINSLSNIVKKDITDLGIPAQDTTYDAASQNKGGLMTRGDKKKLDEIESNANNYSHPKPSSNFTAQTQGLYKIGVNDTGHVSNVSSVVKKDITDLGIPAQDTTYKNATTSTAGLMSDTDKRKLEQVQFTKKYPGIFVETATDKGNVGYLTVTQGEQITLTVFDQENISGVAQYTDARENMLTSSVVTYTINGQTRNKENGGSFTVNLVPNKEYDLYIFFGGSAKYYQMHRALKVKVEAP